jgi:hypothetical protein
MGKMPTIDNYRVFLGIYDHKLGPICTIPRTTCEWLKKTLEDATGLIQDGLNTKSKVLNIKRQQFVVQVNKFELQDPKLRGGKLRCSLFIIVPLDKQLIPNEEIIGITEKLLQIAKKYETYFDNDECDQFLAKWENELNNGLPGAIGRGQIEHKFRDLLNTIIGYSELLIDGVQGEINEEQKESLTYIYKYAQELVGLGHIFKE